MNKFPKILIVFGTRPEAIKMAPVIKALNAHGGFDFRVCVTAQHRDMLDSVMSLFELHPDFDLNLMKKDQDLTDITNAVLENIRPIIKSYQPDLILVHGDTTTTFSTTLAAFYQRIPVGHVEAGLRTGNIMSPWPEEANRKMVSSIAQLHFAPTASARANLLADGIPEQNISVTGNTVIDALHEVVKKLEEDPERGHGIASRLGLDFERRTILVTGHRRENFGSGFERICNALSRLSQRSDIQIIYPVHLNPNVKELVESRLSNLCNVHLIPPQDYLPFVYLMNLSTIILTDSGGIQEEAPSLGKPVLLMRDTTERPEAVSAGTVRLVGTDEDKIVSNVNKLLDNQYEYKNMSLSHNPYGNGEASKHIISKIVSWWNKINI